MDKSDILSREKIEDIRTHGIINRPYELEKALLDSHEKLAHRPALRTYRDALVAALVGPDSGVSKVGFGQMGLVITIDREDEALRQKIRDAMTEHARYIHFEIKGP